MTCSGTFYQIFIPSFCDSNGDGIGDINGIISKLDYLHDLGIEGIWLSPIHPSPSYHKYDVLNYYDIAPEYGTLKDFDRLINISHEKGIRILLDLVLNCPSKDNPYFTKALKDKNCKERNWFWFKNTNDSKYIKQENLMWLNIPSWRKTQSGEEYIGIYADCMPDFNFNSQSLIKECKNIIKFWLDKGVDGFRLDSAMHLFSTSEVEDGVSHHAKNISLWIKLRRYCRQINPNCYLVGEVWTQANERALYYKGLDSTFHFNLGNYIKDIIDNNLDVELFVRKMESAYLSASLVCKKYIDCPFLSNHDMQRFSDFTRYPIDKLKLSAAIYLTHEGNPFVYYGEELGIMPNVNDYSLAFNKESLADRSRTTFDWGTNENCQATFLKGYLSANKIEQEQDKYSLLSFYKFLINLRKNNECLRFGRIKYTHNENKNLLIYSLGHKNKKVILIHNLSSNSIPLDKKYWRYGVNLMTYENKIFEQVNAYQSILIL